MSQVDEKYTDGYGQRLLVHRRSSCTGACAIHNPSDHPLKDAKTFWRADRGIMERICEHGVGHPDPDGIAFIMRTRGRKAARVESVHGCDGCCQTPGGFNG